MRQGQVGINDAKVQLIFLIASVLRKKTKKRNIPTLNMSCHQNEWGDTYKLVEVIAEKP